MTAALSMKELKAAAPAAFSTRRAAHMSEEYAQVQTSKILERLMDNGFVPVQAQQDKPRQRDPLTVRHCIVMRHGDHMNDVPVVGESVPQLMVVNSHNGRTKLRMMGGLYRFVCANGMIVGSNTAAVALTHTRGIMEQVDEETERFGERIAIIGDTVANWQSIELSKAKAQKFAEDAVVLRFGEHARGAYDPNIVLEAKRTEDDGRSLWQVFNTVQEKTVQGGIAGTSANGRPVTSRALTGIGSSIDFNRELWNLADQYAEAA